MTTETLAFILFSAFVVMMLALDLGVFHRKAHEVKMKEALGWSAFWIMLALLFNAAMFFYWSDAFPDSSYSSREAGLAFLTGYLIEKSLSVDNIFVIVIIFTYFSIPPKYQHRVLFWGIIGALVMRAIFIGAGVALISKFHWIIYVFGAFLLFTGIKIAVNKGTKVDPEKNPLIRLFRKFFPVTGSFHGQKFWIREGGRWVATPLFLALLLVEFTDLIFAVDSIPAILAITENAFIVYTSNIFAILGLRSLYFALAGLVNMFRYLHYGLGFILVFVGMKMLLTDIYKIPVHYSLLIIVSILAASIIASLARKEPKLRSGIS
jgi:tellurite resistance protein TerC